MVEERITTAHLQFAFRATPETATEVLNAHGEMKQYLTMMEPLLVSRMQQREAEDEALAQELDGMRVKIRKDIDSHEEWLRSRENRVIREAQKQSEQTQAAIARWKQFGQHLDQRLQERLHERRRNN